MLAEESQPHISELSTDPDADADISDSDGSDDDRNHKHKRRESPPLLNSSLQNTQNAPPNQENQESSSLNKKRVRPNNNQFNNERRERRFRPNSHNNNNNNNNNINNNNNNFHGGRGRGRARNNNNNMNNNNNNWGPHLVPQLEMHDLALLGGPGPGPLIGGPGPFGFMPPGLTNGMMMDPVAVALPHHHHIMMRQRCADFEERGFCLRGDMCPMEHGVNRIVVDDVQSLSQLKLLGPGPKPIMQKDPIRQQNNVLQSVISAPDADLYDPDQPLWNNNNNTNNNVNSNNGSKPDPISNTEDPNSSVWCRITSKNPTRNPNSNPNSNTNPNPNLQEGETRQRATRTLYLYGVPQKDNKPDLLFAHFRKFGTVIDIYVPFGTERAFVQFSKKEEAEAALISPDAVMGNRFIRVLWANRDRVNTDESNSNNNSNKSGQVKGGKEKGSLVITPVKKSNVQIEKKTESFELLEELRKKQEDLARKRDEFRKQLAKLEKQASFNKKGETSNTSSNFQNALTASPKSEVKSVRKEATQKIATKDPVTPLSGFRPNRYKIDNRPVMFRILSLPKDISDISILKEHFSQFGELVSITLEEKEKDQENENEKEKEKDKYALVTYIKHEPAERAFSSGNSFKGHILSFEWVKNTQTNKIVTPVNTKSPQIQTKMEKSISPVSIKAEMEKSISPASVKAEMEKFVSPINGAGNNNNNNTDGGKTTDADVAKSGEVDK